MSNIDYEEQLAAEESKKQAALSQNDQLYTDMIEKSNQFYQEQQNAVENWKETQSQLQQQQTDFTIQQIEQQKEQKQKDYIKEQKGAYTDWKRQSNEYGVQAEQMADAGLGNTGVSESAKVSGYNTYQNRIIAARDSLNLAFLNYENGMKEAQLQNSSALAQLAYESYVKQVELAFSGFQHENQLLLEQADRRMEIEAMYDNRYQAILDQINGDGQIDPPDDEEPPVSGPEEAIDVGDYAVVKKPTASTEKVDVSYPINYQDAKLTSKILSSNVKKVLGVDDNSTIYKAGGTYYVKTKDGDYVDITKEISFSNGYQPRYINGYELKSVGTVKANGLNGNDAVKFLSSEKQNKQNVWKAGNKYYVWNGKTKTYVDVTDAFRLSKLGNLHI